MLIEMMVEVHSQPNLPAVDARCSTNRRIDTPGAGRSIWTSKSAALVPAYEAAASALPYKDLIGLGTLAYFEWSAQPMSVVTPPGFLPFKPDRSP